LSISLKEYGEFKGDMKNNIINQLYKKYHKYGVTKEEIEYIVSAGLEYGLDPEIVRENADRQLEEEYDIKQ